MNKHIVFDLDGTLSDTQKIHEQIESNFLKSKGVIIEPTLIGKRFAGRTPQEWIAEVLTKEKIQFTKEELDNFVNKKDEIIISLLNNGEIELIPFAYDIIVYLKDKGYKIGISSGACRKFINEFVKYFKLTDTIIASTSANEVANKKPHPDVFLESFKKIEKTYGLPDQKYVIGDGWSDMEGGHKSGAKTIWLNNLNKARINDIFCNYEVKSLIEIKDIL